MIVMERIGAGLAALLLSLMPMLVESAEEAAGWGELATAREITSVGGPNAFSPVPIQTPAELQEFFERNRADLKRALEEAAWEGDPEDLFAAVREGRMTETELPPNGTLRWMAYRRRAEVGVIRDLKWSAAIALPAFEIHLADDEWRWVFIVPKTCGNLALRSRAGTAELTLALVAGVLELTDAEGRPLTIRGGESGTVSAPPSALRAGREQGEVGIPATVAVAEGEVEFLAFGGPVSLLVEGGYTATARIDPDGSLAFDLPITNPGAMPIRVGDAVGTLSAGAGLSAEWTPPVCRLAVSPSAACTPAQFTIDATSSETSHGTISTAEVTVTDPGGAIRALDPPAEPGVLRWTHTMEQPGTYRVSAVVISDRGLLSRNPCVAEVAVHKCLPPPPSCEVALSAPVVERFDRLAIDASASSSEEGNVESVLVEVYDDSGALVNQIELTSPFTAEIASRKSGTLTYRAVAVDRHGQRSEVPWEGEVVVRPRTRLVSEAFIGHEQRQTEETAEGRGALTVGAKGGLTHLLRHNLALGFAFGAFANTDHSGRSGVFGDVEFNWVGARGFAGVGVGMWDVTNDETRDATWLMHAGQDTSWKLAGRPVQAYLEARFFFDAPGTAADNFVFVAGLRFSHR